MKQRLFLATEIVLVCSKQNRKETSLQTHLVQMPKQKKTAYFTIWLQDCSELLEVTLNPYSKSKNISSGRRSITSVFK